MFFLVGILESALFHFCNPEFHITRVRHHSLYFYDAHSSIYSATTNELETHNLNLQTGLDLEVLDNKDRIIQMETFWAWAGSQAQIEEFYETGIHNKKRTLGYLKEQVRQLLKSFPASLMRSVKHPEKMLTQFKIFTDDANSLVVLYAIGQKSSKVFRIRPSHCLDAMAAPAACKTIEYRGICTDIFYDHGPYIQTWLERLKTYSKDLSLGTMMRNLLVDDVHLVQASIDELYKKLRRKENVYETTRLLYATLYHWYLSDKALSKSVCYRVSRIMEDLLTERPMTFPRSRTNRSVFRGDKALIQVKIDKPYRIKRDNIQARLQWTVNGNRKRTLPMENNAKADSTDKLVYEVELPIHKGWIHYAVQFTEDQGLHWNYEQFDPNSHGMIKFVADERGQRVLSLYADTFNLELDENLKPVRDDTGAYKYGSFDQLAEQLEDIKAEGYTRIYPLGALELGWAGEAGPDPSVFSIWDGKTIRPDLGGLEGLLRLKKRADELNMKIILCIMSHYSKANTNYPYRLPVYIKDLQGKLTRRAGWDGEWDEWHDSFMVNMREFDNVQYLSSICEELTEMGFALRVDVGHGFDTVFPVDCQQPSSTKLFGDITVPGFEPVDLRGTRQANIPILYASYRAQKANPSFSLFYSEQWHGNEERMTKSGTVPYNAIIKNLENIRDGEEVNFPQGLNDNMLYLQDNYNKIGGQTLSMFNSHDEESPISNYQNMIWPTAAFLVFSSYGPLMYHISRLPDDTNGSFRKRFDLAYLECWKHWVNNRYAHPWQREEQVRQQLSHQYPLLNGYGAYLRGLFQIANENPALTKGTITPLETNNGRIAAFLRSYNDRKVLCVFNFPNPHDQGQQAISREFNFRLNIAGTDKPAIEIYVDGIYEIKEQYNNVEGRHRRGNKQYWSGQELLTLGFCGVLPPVSSHVYEIIERDYDACDKMVLTDSFVRYFSYSKQDRLGCSFIARIFAQACHEQSKGFEKFCELFTTVVDTFSKSHQLRVSDLSTLLGELCEHEPEIQNSMVDYLMRIGVNEKGLFTETICTSAGQILQSMNVGPVVLVSPESKFSGSSGGVGLYTTDIADVLSEMGFQIIIVTPLYECNRKQIFDQYKPRYEGHSFNVHFPSFHEDTQSIVEDDQCTVVNLYRTRIVRKKHGQKASFDVFYLENAEYFNEPYGGTTSEDKIRRGRMISQGALEALRTFNVYPSVIQTNEWPTWLVPVYLKRWDVYRNDPHFKKTQVLSMMHNPHPAYSISLDEANPARREYYLRVLGLDPLFDLDVAFNVYSSSGYEINFTYMMLKTSPFIGTVSRAMQERILAEPWLFGHAKLFQEKYQNGRFFGRRNGFNMGARQRFWFGGRNSLLETYSRRSQRRLFSKYTRIKKSAKLKLQNDPKIGIRTDNDEHNHVIFGMLHRICRQKGFELLVDWKVYDVDGQRRVCYEPGKMDGNTMLEYFLSCHRRAQFVICGRVEGSPDGLRYHSHLQRIKNNPCFSEQLGYFPEGSLPSSLYRNLYIGSQYFVMPSGGDVGEPCGISQQEAHAGGTPVIAHHQDGLIRTVADKDFGDTNSPPNGIKFSGFTGEALLDALNDAMEIYTNRQRKMYKDDKG
ncbi:MAG: glycogen/starch synthase, partial [Phycisphaerae bacterium]|nr:glycogen/starch synthase [Phycisphaerae bacterium]